MFSFLLFSRFDNNLTALHLMMFSVAFLPLSLPSLLISSPPLYFLLHLSSLLPPFSLLSFRYPQHKLPFCLTFSVFCFCLSLSLCLSFLVSPKKGLSLSLMSPVCLNKEPNSVPDFLLSLSFIQGPNRATLLPFGKV